MIVAKHLLAWVVGFLIAAEASAAALPPVEAFALPGQMRHAALSPDGEHIAFVFQRDNTDMIAVAPSQLGEGAQIRVRSVHPMETIWSISWSGDRVIYQTRRPTPRSREDTRTFYIRTFVYSAPSDLSSSMPLNTDPRDRRHAWLPRPQFSGDITHLLPDDPQHILQALNWREWETKDLYRTHVETGELTRIMRGRTGTQGYLTDHAGNVVAMYGLDRGRDTGDPFFVVTDGADDWIDLSRFINTDDDFLPFGRHEDGRLYVASNHDADTTGLFLFDPVNQSFDELLFRHPFVDIGGLVYSAGGGTVVGVHYTEDQPDIHYFDAGYSTARTQLQMQLERTDVRFVSVAPKAGRSLVEAGGPSDPGGLYLYEHETRQLTEFGRLHPELDIFDVGGLFNVTLTARDGLNLPGYITLPHGREPGDAGAPLPFIILVHGGPAARDLARFDARVQFLTSRGYGVLQVNFRGSRGLGRTLQAAGQGQWGAGMQDDVDDAAEWLTAEGLADPERIGVMGASYGGYAALMAAARNNDRFAAAISINGVTDLNGMIQHSQRFFGLERRLREELEGVDLRAMSPANSAADIEIPVFLAHATYDSIVPYSQMETFRRRFGRQGEDAVFVELISDTHGVELAANRYILLAGIEAFLAIHMPSAELGGQTGRRSTNEQ
jgi:dipeptidyl aminopeptidase/acylaminoacyl peptidase